MNKPLLALLCFTALLPFAAGAQPDEVQTTTTDTATADQRIAVAVKAGAALPSLFSALDTTWGLEVEAGVLLLDGQLELDAVLGYARPPTSFAADDPRLEGGNFTWRLDQDVLTVGAVGRYRFLPAAGPWNAYAAAGPRVYFLRSRVTGESGGADLGENVQTGTELGLSVAGGAELRLGPGAALAELELGFGRLRGLVTGQSAASALGLLVGYRFRF
jgi:hypothetical protein